MSCWISYLMTTSFIRREIDRKEGQPRGTAMLSREFYVDSSEPTRECKLCNRWIRWISSRWSSREPFACVWRTWCKWRQGEHCTWERREMNAYSCDIWESLNDRTRSSQLTVVRRQATIAREVIESESNRNKSQLVNEGKCIVDVICLVFLYFRKYAQFD